MVSVRYKTDLHESYAIADIPAETDLGRYGFQMLERNKIRGILTCKQRTEEGQNRLYFNITGKRSLRQEFADREMELEDMVELIRQIMEVLEEARKYLLTEKMTVFLPQYMYRGMEDGELYLMLFPWEQEEAGLQELAEFFLEKISHRDEHGVNAVYHFYKQQKEPFFSFSAFLPVMERESILKQRKQQESFGREEKLKGSYEIPAIPFKDNELTEPEEEQRPSRAVSCWVIFLIASVLLQAAVFFVPMADTQAILCQASAAGMLLLTPVSAVIAKKRRKDEGREEPEYHMEKEDWGEASSAYEETVFFEESRELWKLQYTEMGKAKEYTLREFPVTIGKLEGDIVLKDASVSRIHCRIEERGTRKYVRDVNSTNGTFLNGMKLHSGEIMEIEKNDEIRVGKVILLVV